MTGRPPATEHRLRHGAGPRRRCAASATTVTTMHDERAHARGPTIRQSRPRAASSSIDGHVPSHAGHDSRDCSRRHHHAASRGDHAEHRHHPMAAVGGVDPRPGTGHEHRRHPHGEEAGTHREKLVVGLSTADAPRIAISPSRRRTRGPSQLEDAAPPRPAAGDGRRQPSASTPAYRRGARRARARAPRIGRSNRSARHPPTSRAARPAAAPAKRGGSRCEGGNWWRAAVRRSSPRSRTSTTPRADSSRRRGRPMPRPRRASRSSRGRTRQRGERTRRAPRPSANAVLPELYAIRANERVPQCSRRAVPRAARRRRSEPLGVATDATIAANTTAASAVTPVSFGKNTNRFMHDASGIARSRSGPGPAVGARPRPVRRPRRAPPRTAASA